MLRPYVLHGGAAVVIVVGLLRSAQAGDFFVSDDEARLWTVDVATGAAEWIGTIRDEESDADVTMNDIAFSPLGELYGISFPDNIYRINLEALNPNDPERIIPASLIGAMGIHSSGPFGKREINSLAFDQLGSLGFATFAPLSSGELGTVDTTTAEASLVGFIGHNNGGDMAFAPDGRLFMNSCRVVGLLWNCSTTHLDDLIEVNPLTAEGTKKGSIGFRNVYGLDFVEETLFGVTAQSELIRINTATGAGSLVDYISPPIAATGAATRGEGFLPLPPSQPLCPDSRLPEYQEERNLVLVTHGWNGSFPWVQTMRDSIRDQIHLEHLAGNLNEDDWQVFAYNWTDLAGNLLTRPEDALVNAISLGTCEGYELAGRGYEYVHLIGHSAGAGLITYAAYYTDLLSESTTVQTTFLDAYSPGLIGQFYGKGADWAEHYVHQDSPNGIFASTNQYLPRAYNVDVTDLKPDSSGGHPWPHEFYQETIAGSVEGAGPYGFGLSLAGGNYDPGAYPVGQTVVLPVGIPELVTGQKLHWDRLSNLTTLNPMTSLTGLVEVQEDTVTMQTASPVWLRLHVDVPEFGSLLRLDLVFTSNPAAEGLFAVYLDDDPLGTVDERFVPAGSHQYVFFLGDSEPGLHTLAFRLDSFSSSMSQVTVSNINLGLLALVGDANLDGKVDRDDIAILVSNIGMVAGASTGDGDFDGDGAVTLIDLALTQTQLGEQIEISSAVVPEPSTLTLSGLGILCVLSITGWRYRNRY